MLIFTIEEVCAIYGVPIGSPDQPDLIKDFEGMCQSLTGETTTVITGSIHNGV